MTSAKRPGWPARIGAMLFSGVFMLGFGGGGLFFGLLPLLDTARQAWTVSDWVPVSAQVLDAQLDQQRGSKGSITYRLTARYGYRYQGRDHESTRVGLEVRPGADNIGDWHQRWHQQLSDARSRELPVAAWVNPRQPDQAVLERQVRWGLALFRLPFALLFTAVGVGAGVIFVRALLGLPSRQRQLSSAAATDRPAALKLPGGRQSLPDLPPAVRGTLQLPGSSLRFVRRWPRVLALSLLLPVPVVLLLGPPESPGRVFGLVLTAVVVTAWLALALHLATLRWEWRVEGGALYIDRSSWLRTHHLRLDPQDLRSLSHEVVFTSRTNGGPTVEHRRVLAQTASGTKQVLTPALTGADAAEAVIQHLRQALPG